MRWSRQVWHVATKDVRQHARVLGIGVVAVVIDIARTAHWVGAGEGVGQAWPLGSGLPVGLSVLVGLLATALVVQADPPSTSDAFWTTRPLRPSAVFSAKVLVIGAFVLAIPLIAQGVLLWSHGVAASELAVHLWPSFFVYGGMVSVVAMIAGLTPDLRTLAVSLVGLLVAWAILQEWSWRFIHGISSFSQQSSTGVLRAALILLGSAAALGVQYRTRRRGRSLVVAAAMLAGWALAHTVVASMSEPWEARAATATAAPEAPAATVTVTVTDRVQLAQIELTPSTMEATLDQPWNAWGRLLVDGTDPRYEYRADVVWIGYAEGDAPATRMGEYRNLLLVPAQVAGVGDPELLAPFEEETSRRMRLGTLTAEQVAVIQAGRAHLEVEITVGIYQYRHAGSLSTAPGSLTRVGGSLFRTGRQTGHPLDSYLLLLAERSERHRDADTHPTVRAALYDPTTHEALPLEGESRSNNGHPMVTPGSSVRVHTMALNPVSVPTGTPGGGPALSDIDIDERFAEVVIYSGARLGTYRVRRVIDGLPPRVPDWR